MTPAARFGVLPADVALGSGHRWWCLPLTGPPNRFRARCGLSSCATCFQEFVNVIGGEVLVLILGTQMIVTACDPFNQKENTYYIEECGYSPTVVEP